MNFTYSVHILLVCTLAIILETAGSKQKCPKNKIAPSTKNSNSYAAEGRTFAAFYDLLFDGGGSPNVPQSTQQDEEANDDCDSVEDYDETDVRPSTAAQKVNGQEKFWFLENFFKNPFETTTTTTTSTTTPAPTVAIVTYPPWFYPPFWGWPNYPHMPPNNNYGHPPYPYPYPNYEPPKTTTEASSGYQPNPENYDKETTQEPTTTTTKKWTQEPTTTTTKKWTQEPTTTTTIKWTQEPTTTERTKKPFPTYMPPHYIPPTDNSESLEEIKPIYETEENSYASLAALLESMKKKTTTSTENPKVDIYNNTDNNSNFDGSYKPDKNKPTTKPTQQTTTQKKQETTTTTTTEAIEPEEESEYNPEGDENNVDKDDLDKGYSKNNYSNLSSKEKESVTETLDTKNKTDYLQDKDKEILITNEQNAMQKPIIIDSVDETLKESNNNNEEVKEEIKDGSDKENNQAGGVDSEEFDENKVIFNQEKDNEQNKKEENPGTDYEEKDIRKGTCKKKQNNTDSATGYDLEKNKKLNNSNKDIVKEPMKEEFNNLEKDKEFNNLSKDKKKEPEIEEYNYLGKEKELNKSLEHKEKEPMQEEYNNLEKDKELYDLNENLEKKPEDEENHHLEKDKDLNNNQENGFMKEEYNNVQKDKESNNVSKDQEKESMKVEYNNLEKDKELNHSNKVQEKKPINETYREPKNNKNEPIKTLHDDKRNRRHSKQLNQCI